MMWGRYMFYRNGRPPAMGGSRGHNGGGPRCGDKNPFGLWVWCMPSSHPALLSSEELGDQRCRSRASPNPWLIGLCFDAVIGSKSVL